MTVTKEQIAAAFDGPALFTNKVLLTGGEETSRLSFLEIGEDGVPRYRTAVRLTNGDLLAVADMINKVIESDAVETAAA